MSNHIKELETTLQEELNVDDIDHRNESEGTVRYDITSYGIDFDVEGLVKRIKRGDVYVPAFQRNFVWNLTESSRLIESLLLGLPVPGIFLAQDPQSKKMLVIDGQQRLMSLYYFSEGYFNYKKNGENKRVFKLRKVQHQYEGKTYKTLNSQDRINLDYSVIHATVVKQDAPSDDDTSIYHIFERLNSGGRKLMPQEIRTAVYHGAFIDRIKKLNENKSWRSIYGKINGRMKDQELIIRFFAMLEGYHEYRPSMTEFLNKFTKKYRANTHNILNDYSQMFIQCCELFEHVNDGRPFRLVNALNVAFFDSAMVGLANYINDAGIPDANDVEIRYNRLHNHEEFIEVISQSTGSPRAVKTRMEIAKVVFSEA